MHFLRIYPTAAVIVTVRRGAVGSEKQKMVHKLYNRHSFSACIRYFDGTLSLAALVGSFPF